MEHMITGKEMNMVDIIATLQKIGIVPVVKINDAKNAAGLAQALGRGGLPAAEITFRTDAAEQAIRQIAQRAPDVFVCAGTILSVENAKRAVEAGAKSIISPGTNPDVVEWCLHQQIPVIPGCATPSEVERCMRMGLKLVKLFPAEAVGGVKLLKALSGPYGDMKFMPTGGISQENVKNYLLLPNVVACGGSWMVPEALVDSADFHKIEALTRAAANLYTKLKTQA